MIRAVSESFPLPPASDQRHSSMLQPPSPQAVTSPETPLSPLDMPEASPPEELTPGEQEPADIQITPSVTTAPEFERYEGDFRPGDTIRFDRDITQIWFKHEDVNGDGRTDTVLYNNAEGRADVEGGGVYGVINDFAGWPDPENLSNGRDNSFILALEIV